MQLDLQPPLLPVPVGQDVKELYTWLVQVTRKLRQFIDGAGLGFGDGVNSDNVNGIWVSYTSNAVANTEDAVAHNLGVVPVGYLVFSQDKAASCYKGPTAWTTANIYLKSSTATTAFLLFVVGPSNQGRS